MMVNHFAIPPLGREADSKRFTFSTAKSLIK